MIARLSLILPFLALLSTPVAVEAVSCDLCGCEGCKPGNKDAIVVYLDPYNPGKKLQNSCQALHEIALGEINAFNEEQCGNLYKTATRVCSCFYPDGRDVEPFCDPALHGDCGGDGGDGGDGGGDDGNGGGGSGGGGSGDDGNNGFIPIDLGGGDGSTSSAKVTSTAAFLSLLSFGVLCLSTLG